MSEPIEFPLNFERYMEMGEDALAEGLYAEAYLNFEEAYNLKEDIKANLALVKLLMARSEFLAAKKIADELRREYLMDEQRFALYLKLLIGNQEFIKGRKLLVTSELSEAEQAKLLTEVEQAETFFQTFQPKERSERQELTATLATSSFFQQAQILLGIEKLPQGDYLDLAISIISQGQGHLLLRNALLESLVQLGVKREVTIKTIEGTSRLVSLLKLPEVTTQNSYRSARIFLQEQLEKSVSDLNRQLQEELRMQFTFLYPLADEFIQDPELWVTLFLDDYMGTDSAQEKGNTKEQFFYQKLQAEIKKQSMAMTI